MATTEINFPNVYNRELILDLTLNAFYIYDMSHTDEPLAPNIHDYIPVPKNVLVSIEDVVWDEVGVIVTDNLGCDVTVTIKTSQNRNRDLRMSNFKFLCTSDDDVLIAEYNDYSFLDWVSVLGAGVDFSSYLITAYNMTGDLALAKQTIYINTFCNRSETIYGLGDGGGVELQRQSSCLVQSQWDWHNSDDNAKWGTEFEAYRFLLPQPIAPASGDPFTYGATVITTKNKLRGRGKALSLKFTASTGKDLQLLGWALQQYKVDVP
jgi:hypothetical protein